MRTKGLLLLLLLVVVVVVVPCGLLVRRRRHLRRCLRVGIHHEVEEGWLLVDGGHIELAEILDEEGGAVASAPTPPGVEVVSDRRMPKVRP